MNPDVSPEIARRFSLDSELPGAADEAAEARSCWPGSLTLSGSSATKAEILDRLPAASFLFISGHHVRDLDAPFLGFIPVASPPGAPADEAILEAADIRALDLSGCRLALLASCSSGAPYRNADRPGATLGDAFLDAGAKSVVGSYWDVEDQEARNLMIRFLRRWRSESDDAQVMSAIAREAMRAGAAPREWAAWAVHEVAGDRVP